MFPQKTLKNNQLCPKCGKYTLSTPLNISPRSLLFMLKKENVITEDDFKELDKDWKKYRKTHNLDAYGHDLDKNDKKNKYVVLTK